MIEFILSKPVLIGLHLGFAIIGIDAFLWLLGKFKDKAGSPKSRVATAFVGALAFIASWVVGGYYYVIYYGGLVKPVIKEGLAPWAHNIIMETKEHIFLFVVPLAIVVLLLASLEDSELDNSALRKLAIWLTIIVAGIALLVGAMGFVISAAARWGVLN